jgi:hypothetical protein
MMISMMIANCMLMPLSYSAHDAAEAPGINSPTFLLECERQGILILHLEIGELLRIL